MNQKISAFIQEAKQFLELLFNHPSGLFWWLWDHRKEPNNRAKRRRMHRDITSGKVRERKKKQR